MVIQSGQGGFVAAGPPMMLTSIELPREHSATTELTDTT